MTNSVSVISSQEVLGKSFDIYGNFENPLFLAKDVAEVIDYSKTSEGYYNVSKMLMTVDEDEKVTITIGNSDKKHNASFLTENGLYEVLMLSKKPIAKEFKKQIKALLHDLRTNKAKIVKTEVKYIETPTMPAEELHYKRAMLLKEIANNYKGKSETYCQVLDAYVTKELSGQFLLPLPPTKKTYSATEIGKMFNVSATKIGQIANKLNLKTSDYGQWSKDKSKYSPIEVDVFRYFDNAISVFKEHLKA